MQQVGRQMCKLKLKLTHANLVVGMWLVDAEDKWLVLAEDIWLVA
jgi:hypothetical protein